MRTEREAQALGEPATAHIVRLSKRGKGAHEGGPSLDDLAHIVLPDGSVRVPS